MGPCSRIVQQLAARVPLSSAALWAIFAFVQSVRHRDVRAARANRLHSGLWVLFAAFGFLAFVP
jgi:hypothetical protein